MILRVTPSWSSRPSVGGWIEAARWSFTGAGSCSNTVTGTPRWLSASAHTMPTGPAPTITTRELDFCSVMLRCHSFDRSALGRIFCGRPLSIPDRVPGNVLATNSPLLGLDAQLAHEIAPQLGIRRDDPGEFRWRIHQRLGAQARQAFEKFRAALRRHELARQRVDDIARRAGGANKAVVGDDRRAR